MKTLYYEPRYNYYEVFDNFTLNFRIQKLKEKGVNSYFKRINTDINYFYDFFNYMTFDIDDKIYLYIQKYYGYSNIYEINNNAHDLSVLTKPIFTFENEKSILNQLFTLENNKLYSGILDYETLYDIYVNFDSEEEEIIKMDLEDNPYNNLVI